MWYFKLGQGGATEVNMAITYSKLLALSELCRNEI
jgi:hypothetical protein